MALDIGEKRIGVALSDPTATLATPLLTIQRHSESSAVMDIMRLLVQEEIGEIVVGLPLSLSGEIGPQAECVSSFTTILSRDAGIPVIFVDERYSTVEAERLLRDAGIKPSRNKSRIDSAAAAVILQSYLDSKTLSQPT